MAVFIIHRIGRVDGNDTHRSQRDPMLRYGLTLSIVLLATLPAFAELPCTNAGPRYYPYNGYYGLPGSPGIVIGPAYGAGLGWGWWPWGWGYWNGGVNGSFYSNGLSLYGQPVPSPGGITPGFFGGSDLARNYWNMPPYIGLGWWGYRNPLPNVHGAARDFPQNPLPPNYSGPRFATRDVRARYDWVKANPAGESNREMAELYKVNYGIILTVRLPEENCPLYLQGQPMSSTGKERVFQSARLPAGSNYKYTVTVKLPGDKTETKEVIGKPGDSLVVDFTTPPAP